MQIHAKFKHRWRWCSRHENWLNCLICSVCEAHTVCWLKCHNNVIYRHVIQIVTNYIQPKWQWNLNVISIHQPSIPHQRTSAIAIQFSDLTIDKVFNEQNDVTSSTKEQNATILIIKWKLLSGMLSFEDIKTNILHYKLFFLHSFWSKMYEKVIFCHPIAIHCLSLFRMRTKKTCSILFMNYWYDNMIIIKFIKHTIQKKTLWTAYKCEIIVCARSLC